MTERDRNALVVNFFGGPGTGKTTAAARLFVELKLRNVDCEMHDEQARQCIQQGQIGALDVQPYLFGLQLYKLRTTAKNTDVVIMDSPLMLNPIYDKAKSSALRALVLEEHRRFRNLNLFCARPTNAPHSMVGRVHDLQESIVLDERIKALLQAEGESFREIGEAEDHIRSAADEVERLITEHRRATWPDFFKDAASR